MENSVITEEGVEAVKRRLKHLLSVIDSVGWCVLKYTRTDRTRSFLLHIGEPENDTSIPEKGVPWPSDQ